MQRLLTPRETDQLLRYPNGRSVKLAKAGKLPAVILPDGEFRFVYDDIQTLLRPQVTGDPVVVTCAAAVELQTESKVEAREVLAVPP